MEEGENGGRGERGNRRMGKGKTGKGTTEEGEKRTPDRRSLQLQENVFFKNLLANLDTTNHVI